MVGYYIKRGIKRAAEFTALPSNIGTTEQDYKAGKWVEITQQQADFYTQNPYASFSEIMDMEMNPPPPIIEMPFVLSNEDIMAGFSVLLGIEKEEE